MKRSFLFFLLACCYVLATFATPNTPQNPGNMINAIDPHINMGIKVIDLNTGATLYEKNAKRPFIPASNMKLFSDAAALMLLGPDYTFKNRLLLGKSTLKNGVLQGNLYFDLPGDPSFNQDKLRKLIQALKKWHIHTIEGNIYLDSALKDIPPYAPGGPIKDRGHGYYAKIAPVILDTNRIVVAVNPGSRMNQKAICEVFDNSHSITIQNEVLTRENTKKCGVSFTMDEKNNITIRGCVGVDRSTILHQMAIQNPLLYTENMIKQSLKDEKITLNGHILLGDKPTVTMVLATTHSKPIRQLIADTLKPSDNLYADSLFLHTARHLKGRNTNWEEAKILVQQFLQKETGIHLSEAVLVDGSGLSRLDKVTPEQTIHLLSFLFKKFPMSYEYIAALPVSGRDGTLEKRFKKPSEEGLLRAKTGTLNGVLSLSGYLYTANAHTLAFAIYINTLPHTNPSVSGRYRHLVDKLCQYFLRQAPQENMPLSNQLSNNGKLSFEKQIPEAARERKQDAKWRKLEKLVKHALKSRHVNVRYRPHELILEDHQKDAKIVIHALQSIAENIPFTVTLETSNLPNFSPSLLILKTESNALPKNIQRIWTLQET